MGNIKFESISTVQVEGVKTRELVLALLEIVSSEAQAAYSGQ